MTAYREVDYTNYEGKRALRRVVVRDVYFGTFEPYHREPQWLIKVWDVDREAERVYAQSGVHAWDGVPVAQAPDKAAEREGVAFKEVCETLQAMIDAEVEYMTTNLLGDPEKQHNVRRGRAALAALAPKPTGTEASRGTISEGVPGLGWPPPQGTEAGRGVGAETRYQYREIGEGDDWRDCSKATYDGFASDPHMDTRKLAATPTPPLSPDSTRPAGALKTVADALAKADGWEDPDALWTDNVGVISRGDKGDPVWTQYAETATMVLAALTPSAPIAAPVRDDGATAKLTRRIAILENALKPFAEMDPRNIDPKLNDKLSDWFAPSDFKAAFLAYVDLPAPAGDVPGGAQTREGRR